MTAKLLLNGNFSEQDRKQLTVILSADDIVVKEYLTKSIEPHEVARAVFHDFHALQFLRDLALGKIIDSLGSKVKEWVTKKKPQAEIQISFELNVGEMKPRIRLAFPAKTQNHQAFTAAIDVLITEDFIASLKMGEIVSVAWNEEDATLKIMRL